MNKIKFVCPLCEQETGYSSTTSKKKENKNLDRL